MAAITSQTFHDRPLLDLPRAARAAVAVLLAGARLLRHVFLAAPSASAQRRRADEAAEVRALARQYAKADPGFAADLYAAAARHEGLAEH